jgi:hypothetical protein
LNKKSKRVIVAGGLVGLFFVLWVNQFVAGIIGGLALGWLIGFIIRKDL